MKDSISLSSLQKLARQFQNAESAALGQYTDKDDQEVDDSLEAENDNNSLPLLESKSENEEVPKAVAVPEDSLETDEEDYIEFPTLEKHKTYSKKIIKPQKNEAPRRITVIKSKISKMRIFLHDTEVFEQVSFRKEMQPFVLKNSHAVCKNMEDIDLAVFDLDRMGNSFLNLEKKGKKECLELGCIIKYEISRPESTSLLVTARDLDASVEVIGGPCKIEFHLEDAPESKTEKAQLRKLEAGSKVSRVNAEAGSSINWLA